MKQEFKFKIFKVSTNEYYKGGHWSYRFNHKKKYKNICSKFKDEFKPVDYKIDIYADFYFSSRIIDSSNTTAMLKMIEDGLTENNIIKDDGNKYVGWVACRANKTKEDDYCLLTIVKSK